MLKTLSQATASLALTFGAFAVPLVVFLSGDASYAFDEVAEVSPTIASISAPRVAPLALQPDESEADTVEVAAAAQPAATSGVRRTSSRVVRSTPAAAAPAKSKKKRNCLEDNPDIDRLDASTYSVDRDVLKYYRGHLKELNGLGWASTYKPTGTSEGFIVRGIRCGNDLHEAGFRNGDVISAVNGKAVTTIPQAIAVYATQGGKDQITVSITRKGQKKSMTYHIG